MKGLLSATLSSRKLIEYLLLFLLLASVLSAAAYGGYWYGKQVSKPQPPPSLIREKSTPPTEEVPAGLTASWETLKDEKHGFQFKYPQDWILEPEPKALDSETLVSRSVYDSAGPFKGGTFTVSVRTIPLNDFVKMLEAEALSPTTQITVSGVSGKKVVQQGAGGKQYVVRICLPFKDLTYDVGGYVENDPTAKEKFLSTFDKILSTFRFLDQK